MIFRCNLILIAFLFCTPIASAEIDVHTLANAIWQAEGGFNASRPYGVMKDYCSWNTASQCRKGCIQTIEKWKARIFYVDFLDFIKKFAQIYAPVGAENDPTGLNAHWVRNVVYFYVMIP